MRVSELFNIQRAKKKSLPFLILIITGTLSLLIAAITVYGQYSGSYLINVTRNAHRKGIAISETKDFEEARYDIKITTDETKFDDLSDTLEEALDIEGAVNNDGLFYQEGQEYIAFTFYLKNTGEETVNVNYQIKMVEDYKGLKGATKFKVLEFEQVGENFVLHSEKVYPELDENGNVPNTNTIANVDIIRFRKGEVRKFTFFVWLDGRSTSGESMGGAIKFDWVFDITKEIEGKEELDK